jgi:Polysaccharide pyruvyl transferase
MAGVGILGTKGHVDNVYNRSTEEVMKLVGNNTGNLVFHHAVYHQVADEKYIIGEDLPWDMGTIRRNCRVIVIPSANHIREDFDLTTFVDFLERVELPLVFLGLGAQADDYEQTSLSLHPSILRLLSLAKERSKVIAIRGEFTGRILERFGITNFKVTGCPSNFINLDPDLGEKIALRRSGQMRSFITHGDEPWPKTPEKQEVEKVLATWTMQGAAMQSQQSVPAFMEFIRRDNPYGDATNPEKRGEALRNALMPSATQDQFMDYLAAKLRVYFSVSQWMEDSSKYDFSIGLRLHGNMVAIQSAVPSLFLYHDSRTRELAEIMAVPNMDYRHFLEQCRSVQDAWQRTSFDKDLYRSQRLKLAKNMLSAYEAEGINSTLRPFVESQAKSSLDGA